MIRAIHQALSRFRRRQSGNATIEFVILFPVFMIMVVSGFEAGMLLTRQMMLERGLDVAMRAVRLGVWTEPTHEIVKKAICDAAIIIPNCQTAIQIEMREVSTTAWNVPLMGNSCVDRRATIDPVLNYVPGGRNQLMMVRVCAVFDPMFPATGLAVSLPLDASGGYRLIATSAFVNEP